MRFSLPSRLRAVWAEPVRGGASSRSRIARRASRAGRPASLSATSAVSSGSDHDRTLSPSRARSVTEPSPGARSRAITVNCSPPNRWLMVPGVTRSGCRPSHSSTMLLQTGQPSRPNVRSTLGSMRSPGKMNSAAPPDARASPRTRCSEAPRPMPKVNRRTPG